MTTNNSEIILRGSAMQTRRDLGGNDTDDKRVLIDLGVSPEEAQKRYKDFQRMVRKLRKAWRSMNSK